ncbi:phage head-tail connector protein [Rossellomorea sp. BNER]|uniref:phage head-tail connector protein n=1 Tax=Rossellomorea sp. BNER TaxID=2962031 RepID=UPI003AF23DA3|nr:phage head-tail connector protein [Rossellomorea sp. BNER]
MELQNVKNMLGIKTTKYDDYINEVLPLFIEKAKEECSNSFQGSGKEKLPAGVKLYVAKAIEFNMGQANLKGRSADTVSYSYETNLPRSITDNLAPYKKLRVK